MEAQIRVGDRVRVTQQVQHRRWTSVTEGVVQAFEQRKTGSWFAHAKDDKLWLDWLELVKDDGEVVVCNLDQYSRVEQVEAPGAAATTAVGAKEAQHSEGGPTATAGDDTSSHVSNHESQKA